MCASIGRTWATWTHEALIATGTRDNPTQLCDPYLSGFVHYDLVQNCQKWLLSGCGFLQRHHQACCKYETRNREMSPCEIVTNPTTTATAAAEHVVATTTTTPVPTPTTPVPTPTTTTATPITAHNAAATQAASRKRAC
jgi:hypothetical protein